MHPALIYGLHRKRKLDNACFSFACIIIRANSPTQIQALLVTGNFLSNLRDNLQNARLIAFDMQFAALESFLSLRPRDCV